MATETELERRLHDELHARSGADPLPERVLTDSLALGHRALRRRRRGALLAAAASLVVVSGLVALGAQGQGDPPRPAPAPPTATPTPGPDEPDTVAPVAWANGLPLGAPPEVPYLAGTTVVLPDGTRVETGGSGAGVIGLTVAGLVLLVETETEHPYSFSSRYALVTDSGEVRDLPVSTLTADGAQEAVVSPDGELFTSGGEILDMRDLAVVGEVPEAADILISWTPAGIVYGVGERSYVWSEGHEPQGLAQLPGTFANGTDVGLKGCHVVRLSTEGTTATLSECIDGLRAVSPSGRWALTDDLRLVDVATGASRYLAGSAVHPIPYAFDKVRWDGDQSLMFPVGALLVRCDTSTVTCERATDEHELQDGRLALP